jgi:DNA primase
MIPQSFVQELLGRVDIVDVVDRHVKLKRAGANFVACCPFHSEKTPSFTVSQPKQFYHCFGCGAHGTAIGFLIEYGGLGFVDAVKELAQSVGLKVPEDRSETTQRKHEESDDLHAVLLKAAQYYRSRLKDSSTAIAYLKKRGLSGEIARRFGIGYAPDGWQNLAAAFSDYDGKPLAAAGLVKSKDDNRRYDVFRDRIMFPIVDVRGMVIGFGGRILDTGGGGAESAGGRGADYAAQPKYLNSPETPLFEKGKELYGLYQARRALRESGRVVVVEGYMDVVALAQSGIEYAVATLGTATTPLHVQKLLRQSDEIVFCFDGDAAGRRAAWRALENALAQLQDGKQVKFLFLPDGEDPDTYVRKEGKAAFEGLLANGSVTLSAFMKQYLCEKVDLTTLEGRAALLEHVRPLLAQVSAPFLKQAMIQEFARLAAVDPATLAEKVGARAVSAPAPGPAGRIQRRHVSLHNNEKTVLAALIAKPELVGGLDLELNDRSDDEIPALLREVVDLPEVDRRAGVCGCRDPALFRRPVRCHIREITQRLASEWSEGFDIEAEFRDAVAQIHKKQRDETIRPLINQDPHRKWTPEEAATYSTWQSAIDGSRAKAN